MFITTTNSTLKQRLLQSPILIFPDFSPTAKPFVLQTDASAMGIGTVLEQGGQVVAYASRVLTPPEKSYSVIQQECLAIVYALKQFRHYLLGCHFILQTDRAPLQWLTSQKMEGCYADGHCPCRSLISILNIVKVLRIQMQMPCLAAIEKEPDNRMWLLH